MSEHRTSAGLARQVELCFSPLGIPDDLGGLSSAEALGVLAARPGVAFSLPEAPRLDAACEAAALVAAEIASAPVVSNTGAQTVISPPAREFGGVDTIVLRLHGTWNGAKREEAFLQWEAARVGFEDAGSAGGVFRGPSGDDAWLRVYGHSAPFEGRYEWVFDFCGSTISIADRRGPGCEGKPDVILRLGSLTLMEFGLLGAWELVSRWLESYGFRCSPENARPSEVHLCVDLMRPVAEFVAALEEQRIVCYAGGGKTMLNGRFETIGFELGSRAAVQVQVYDKLKELDDHAGPESEKKREVMRRYRWGGGDPEHSTRVEFRLRRDQLREREVNTFAELLEQLPVLVRYLTILWCRFTDRRPDRENGNQGRAVESDLWREVRQGFESWAGAVKSDRRPGVACPLPTEVLVKQMQGVMLAAIARSDLAAKALASVLFEQVIMLERYGEGYKDEIAGWDAEKWKSIERKRAKIRARIGAFYASGPPVSSL